MLRETASATAKWYGAQNLKVVAEFYGYSPDTLHNYFNGDERQQNRFLALVLFYIDSIS